VALEFRLGESWDNYPPPPDMTEEEVEEMLRTSVDLREVISEIEAMFPM
jgi:hypothetical protein